VLASARLPLVQGISSLVLTALLVVWITDRAMAAAPLGDLTLNVLLRGSEPFRGMTLVEALWTSVSRSAALVGAALLAATVIGVSAGTVFAFSRVGAIRAFAWAIGTVGASLPSFFWAMLLQLVVVLVFVRTQQRIAPTSGFGVDEHLVLPAIALGMRPAAYVFRTTATALEEARHAPHVMTAWAKGLGPRLLAQRHVARNAAPSIAAGIALGGKTALSSLAIVEYVFSWNGAGFGFIQAVATGNVAFASAIALVFALALSLAGVAVAVTTRAMDPRTR
jgi:peptide/nickel transport system permease protein